MALVFKFDEQQLERLIMSIDNLSSNLAKWQGAETQAVKQGFAGVILALGGSVDDETQAQLDALTKELQSSTNQLDSAVKAHQPEGD